MFQRLRHAMACFALACIALAGPAHAGLFDFGIPSAQARPDFVGIDHWINSAPLTMSRLRGKVVLVEFWTYSCINCIHVMPYVKRWHALYRDKGLVVVGVHTPEYAYEKRPANVVDAIRRFGITYPVALDNGYRTWAAFGNAYWPALYLFDRNGKLAYRHIGEGGYDITEQRIRTLLEPRCGLASGPLSASPLDVTHPTRRP